MMTPTPRAKTSYRTACVGAALLALFDGPLDIILGHVDRPPDRLGQVHRGIGQPNFAAAIISGDLEKDLGAARAPLRNWMFLNLEWPAIARPVYQPYRSGRDL